MKNSRFIGICFLIFLGFTFSCHAVAPLEAQNMEESSDDRTAEDATAESDNDVTGNISNAEKVIEVNSVNFIKLKSKPQEIFIPKPEVADVDMLNDSSLYLMGLAPGVTSLVVHGRNGRIIADYQIRVTYPLKAMREAVAEMHQDAEIEIVSVDDSVILKGKVYSPEIALDVQDIISRFVPSGKIINKLSIETAMQVMLKVKIAEVSRKLTKSLGINWRAMSAGKNTNGVVYGFMSGRSDVLPPFGQADMATLRSDIITKGALGAGTESLAVNGGRWLMHAGVSSGLSALIEALANETYASVLAEPTLIALSGKKAVFRSGGEKGYIVKQSGNDSNTMEFKSWGTSIEFTPTVISEDRINITVKPVISSVISENGQDQAPSLTTKEAETTIELGSGQSLAIAGLIQTDKSSASMETPLLADLPLIGTLFRNSNVTMDERELVIIITPYIVKPSSRPLKTPLDMVPRMYSPVDSILMRKFHHGVKKSKSHSAGFIIR